jgi:prolyl oligopeptidase
VRGGPALGHDNASMKKSSTSSAPSQRRRTLTAVAAGASITPWSLLQAAPTSGGAPKARTVPVTDDYFGTRIVDPYRWMEDPKHPDWLPFLEGQNAHTRRTLDALPLRAALARRIDALSGDAAATRQVQPAGESLFFEQRPAGADNFKLFVRPVDATGPGASRVLIDPTTMKDADGKHMSLDWWIVAPDGRHVAYGLSSAGSEASVLHVMAVDTGEVLPERIDKTDFGIVSWLPDGNGFFYNRLVGERGTSTLYQNSQVKLHRLRGNPAQDVVVMARGLDAAVPIEPLQFPMIVVVPGADFALGVLRDIRTEFTLHVSPLQAALDGKPQWRRVFELDAVATGMALVGDALYVLLSDKASPRGRVVKMSVRSPALASAPVVMPQRAAVIEHLEGAKDGVYVTMMDGGVQRLARIAHDGTVRDVALPFEGSVRGVHARPDREGAFVSHIGWFEPGVVSRVKADGSVTDIGIAPKPPIDLAPYEARRAFAVARDGAGVPYTVLARKGLRLDGRNPTLVDAYGAYQSSSTPRFMPSMLAFLDAGGVWVNANVRGGGEYGREWHMAGKKATKPNTWRDLIDVCETLVRERLTSPRHLAITGTSAGGIAIGRAMTERPDLFAAVVCNVGWVNPIRYSAEQNIADIDEWGPAVDRESFRIMLQMDSLHAVRDRTRYPAVLCITGATDPRVAPWHVAKFAARLQAATASAKPVLLRVDFDAGHGVGSTRTQLNALNADIQAFVLSRTGGARRTLG